MIIKNNLIGKFIKRFVCLLLIFTSIFVTGCWDMRDIDKRLLVGNVGIDKSKEPRKFVFTYTMPVVRQIAGGQGGGGGGGSEGGEVKPVMLESTIAYSVTDGARNLALRLNRELFFEHMRVVVIGEDLAREGIKPIINPFMRQIEFNRRSRIAIVEGKAKDLLKVEPWVEVVKAEYFEDLFCGCNQTGKFINADLGSTLDQLHAFNGNVLMSKITPGKSEVDIGGAAVLKNYKLIGWLTKRETQGANFFLGNIRGGDIALHDKKGRGHITFIITGQNRNFKLVSTDDIPQFSLKVTVEGNLADTTEGNVISSKELKKIEKKVSSEIKSEIQAAINKTQKVYRTDVLRICDYMHKFHPKIWKNYKKDWEQIFPEVNIDVKVTTNINGVGGTK